MYRNLIVRESGNPLDSSKIRTCEYSVASNNGNNLHAGASVAAQLSFEVYSPESPLIPGEKLEYWTIDEDAKKVKVATLYADMPSLKSKSVFACRAYDGLSKLEVDASGWLKTHQNAFPMTLRELVVGLCSQVGVSVQAGSFPYSDLRIPAFYADNLSIRQIVSWAAEIACKFVACNPDGMLSFMWYADRKITLGPDKYMSGSLSAKDYLTANIERVQIVQSAKDVGVIYPESTGNNTYVLSQNLLLGKLESTKLYEIATSIYNTLKDVQYVPLSVKTYREYGIAPGDILDIITREGKHYRTYAMECKYSGSGCTVQSRGDPTLGSASAYAGKRYRNLEGRVLEVESDVDGLRVTNKDLEGRVTNLSVRTQGIESSVKQTEENLDTLRENQTKITQDSEKIRFSVEEIVKNGVDKVVTRTGVTVDDEGIKVDKTGEELNSLMSHKEFTIKRNETPVLRATARGIDMENARVRTYLVAGKHSRWESYSDVNDPDQVGCFWVEEDEL